MSIALKRDRPGELSVGRGEALAYVDSFSQPAIAAAVLRQEAERLLSVYVVTAQQELSARRGATSSLGPAAPARQDPRDPGANGLRGSRPRATAVSPEVAAVENLRDEIQYLKTDLDQTLIVVYFEHGSWNQVVDLYLQVLQEAPENHCIMSWARHVLVSSERCGRRDELMESLRHFVTYHPDSNTARRLNSAILEWEAERDGKAATDKR